MSVKESSTETAIDTAETLLLAAEVREGFSKLKRRLRAEAGAAEITPSQASVLTQLMTLGPSTVTELAQAEGVRPQSMGATVAALETAGFIARLPDPEDGRRTILTLSPEAVKKFSASRIAREGWLFRAIQENLSPQEQRELARGFAVLRKLVES